MVYDPVHANIVLFGGVSGSNIYGDTFLYDGNLWTQVAENSASPLPVYGQAMAFDEAGKQVVLFGGIENVNLDLVTDQTWIWDGTEWKDVSVNGPAPRIRSRMAYDPKTEKIVLFGGTPSDSSSPFGDTWEWDGEQWTFITDTGPAPRQGFDMVYDPVREKVILFGGSARFTGGPGRPRTTTPSFNDTWAWDGETWTELEISNLPPGRSYHEMVYDTQRNNIILFGGGNSAGVLLNDMWILPSPSVTSSVTGWEQY